MLRYVTSNLAQPNAVENNMRKYGRLRSVGCIPDLDFAQDFSSPSLSRQR